ncbi:MAG: hypothetical protein HY429_01255 [Candidatus Levybacteria bacterium]|nr:hypothetical protein [Candidatus Levybacteria bacterium]
MELPEPIEPQPQDPINLLNARREEHAAKLRLAKQRLIAAAKRLEAIGDPDAAEAITRDLLYAAQAQADGEWGQALLQAGIEPTKILEVWDKKDDLSRQEE